MNLFYSLGDNDSGKEKKMIVNGKKTAWEAGLTVESPSESRKLPDRPGCCGKKTERLFRRKIITQKRFGKEDQIEIVSFVGGG